MTAAPEFFVPDAEGSPLGEPEGTYAELAAGAGVGSVPPPGERIYAITFEADGETWTATVGKRMRGHRPRKNMHGRPGPVSDGATVLAIFPGTPYRVVTTKGLAPDARSAFNNPVYATPRAVTTFSVPDAHSGRHP